MKKKTGWLTVLMAMVLEVLSIVTFVQSASAAGAPVPNQATPWYADIQVSPTGAFRHADFAGGPSDYGAGLTLALPVNKFVSLDFRALSYEDWKGKSEVDEVSVGGLADFASAANQRLKLQGVGLITRNFEQEDWAFSLGLRVSYQFNKRLSASLGREAVAWFNNRRSWLDTLSITYTL